MPIKFWNDKKDKKFKKAYFSKFKNIFEESSKMNKYLSNIPIFLIREFDLGFIGALEVCKNELF